MESALKAKVVYETSIRRWRTPKQRQGSYDNLVGFVKAAFPPLGHGNFTLLYSDEEGDRVTIASDGDVGDAFQVAKDEDRKSLKIFVVQNGEALNSGGEVPLGSQVCMSDTDTVTESLNAFEILSPRMRPSQSCGSSSTGPACAGEAPDWRTMFKEFVGDAMVREQLEALVKIIMVRLEKGDSLAEALHAGMRCCGAVREHRLVRAAHPYIPCIVAKAQRFVPILKCLGVERVLQIVPKLLEGAVRVAETDDGQGACLDLTPMFRELFPDLIRLLETHIPPNQEQEIDVCRLFRDCDWIPSDFWAGRDQPPAPSCPASAPPSAERQCEAVHHGVQCDGCQKSPIRGPRFKCSVCPNFDLCNGCENKQVHDQSHPMIKMVVPIPKAAGGHGWGAAWRRKCMYPGLRELFFPHRRGPFGRRFGPPPGMPRFGGERGRGGCPWKREQPRGPCGGAAPSGWAAPPMPPPGHHPPPPPMYPPGGWAGHGYGSGHHGHHGGHHRSWSHHSVPDMTNAGAWWRRPSADSSYAESAPSVAASTVSGATLSSMGSFRSAASSASGSKPRPKANFLEDVTLPDRSAYLPSQTLIKTWRMKNPGPLEWGKDVCLRFVKGHKDLIEDNEFNVRNAQPGDQVDVSAVVSTPETPGRYCSYFRLFANGEFFGPRIWVDVFVVKDAPALKAHTENQEREKTAKLAKAALRRSAKVEKLERRRMKVESRLARFKDRLAEIESQQEALNAEDFPANAETDAQEEAKLLATVSDDAPDGEPQPVPVPVMPLQAPLCRCGAAMEVRDAGQCYERYGWDPTVHCDACGTACKPPARVWHCPLGKTAHHRSGYDICFGCAARQPRAPAVVPSLPSQPNVHASNQGGRGPCPETVLLAELAEAEAAVSRVAAEGAELMSGERAGEVPAAPVAPPVADLSGSSSESLVLVDRPPVPAEPAPPAPVSQPIADDGKCAPSVAAPSAPPPDAFQYDDQLASLTVMGFTDVQKNRCLLIEHKGQVPAVLEILLRDQA